MSLSSIKSAFVQAFLATNIFAQDLVQWENMAFDTPATGSWGAFHFVPNNPVVASLGSSGRDEQTGFVQIDLNYPPDTGDKEANDDFETLRNVFTAGSRFIYQGQDVMVTSCGRSQGRIINNFFRVSVTVMFYAQLQR